MTFSSTQIIQKPRSFYSESRNYRNKLNQNNKEFNSSKVINNGVTIQSRRKLSGLGLNIRDNKFSFNKFQSTGGLRNSISFGSNKTNMASPGANSNVYISKVENSSKKTENISNKVNNALL